MNHNISTERYHQSIEDYERLLSREYDPRQEEFRAEHHSSAFRRDESELTAEQIALLQAHGFLPTVRTHSVRKDGKTTDSETWVDRSGATSAEFCIAPARHRGLHCVSTYFADGTAITVWPSDATTLDSPVRQNILGEDELRADIATALDARAEKEASGVRPLLLVDVKTAQLRSEFHVRFLHADPFKAAMANLDLSDLWKLKARVGLQVAALFTVVAIVVTLVFGPVDWVLLFAGLGIAWGLLDAFLAWWGRDERGEDFLGMDGEQFEAMMREIAEQERSKD